VTGRVLVVGVPRGGTTWVARVLASTPGAVYVHEPDGTHDPYAFVAKRDLLYHPMLDASDAAPAYERLWAGAFAGGAAAGTARDRIARRAFAGVTPAEKQAARNHGAMSPRLRIVNATATPLTAPRTGAPRTVIVKSVNATFALDWITQRFDPTVVVVERHPLNVIASWRELGWAPPQGPMYDALRDYGRSHWDVELPDAHSGSDVARVAASCGVLCAALDEAAIARAERISVRHEDLCRDPVDGFAALAATAGLEWTDASAAFVRATDEPGEGYATRRIAETQPDAWRRRLDEATLGEVRAVLDRFPQAGAWAQAT
jgi:hypothetical protein